MNKEKSFVDRVLLKIIDIKFVVAIILGIMFILSLIFGG